MSQRYEQYDTIPGFSIVNDGRSKKYMKVNASGGEDPNRAAFIDELIFWRKWLTHDRLEFINAARIIAQQPPLTMSEALHFLSRLDADERATFLRVFA